MIGEFVLTAVKTLYDIVEKTYVHFKDSKKEQRDKLRDESRKILEEVSYLIDKFTETCDLIVQTLAEFYDARKYNAATFVRISQANRRLFEVSSDVRVLTHSLSSRLDQTDADTIRKIADTCLQIIVVENYIGAEIVSSKDFGLLPIDASARAMKKVVSELFPEAMSDPYPYDHEPSGKATISDMNKALLDLRTCKENLARVLNEMGQAAE